MTPFFDPSNQESITAGLATYTHSFHQSLVFSSVTKQACESAQSACRACVLTKLGPAALQALSSSFEISVTIGESPIVPVTSGAAWQ